jgi:eukaryotic-like serine/threonine-protein kinase
MASAVAMLLLLKFAQDRWRDELIRNNLGTVIYTIAPFDWRAGAVVAAAGDPMPDLTVTVYGARADDTNEPGDPIPDKLVRIVASGGAGNPRVQRISAPGGTVWLRLDNRGRPGERCPPSWIRVQAFPGYRIDDIKRIELAVPTCQATLSDTVKVEAGPFWYGGPGDPPARHYGEPDYTEPERLIDLPAFAMDRTEVSNAAYEPFARLDKLTGYLRPVYTTTTVHIHDGEPAYPVSDIDAFEASAYCRYMGKRLPSDAEWTKAARGGLMVNGSPNRYPRRLYPWGNVARPECVNQDFAVNKTVWTRPVDSLSCGASPYGILQLVGNVQEWIARDGQTDRDNPLHALRGGSTDDDPGDESTTTVFRNHRDPRVRNYSNGVRCVVDPEGAP